MGADIHIYAERKLKDGTWAMCKQYNSMSDKAFAVEEVSSTDRMFHRACSRNYSFFAALAGVRGVGPDPRGLPEDASPLVKEESDGWDSDGHSHSWYSAEEFVPIFMDHHMTEKERTELVAKKLEAKYAVDLTADVLDNYLGIYLPYRDGEEDTSCIRFVFWFDN
jgi:hypothetical protein